MWLCFQGSKLSKRESPLPKHFSSLCCVSLLMPHWSKQVTCPTLNPSVRTWGNEMSWLARPGSGAYLWSERWSQYRPVPTERGKNSNQELELEKGGPRQALQWVSANCWSRLTSPHSARRGLDPKIPLLPGLGKEREPVRVSLSQSFHFSNEPATSYTSRTSFK